MEETGVPGGNQPPTANIVDSDYIVIVDYKVIITTLGRDVNMTVILFVGEI
jgi:hypothetical protein